MTPERWERVNELFEAALEIEPAKRLPFLDAACQSNPGVRAEVERLLAANERAGSFMEEPPVHIAARPLSAGTRLGSYEILTAVGAGGMGEVYRARDTRLDRIVAIKILPSWGAASEEARRRFEREARAISSLNHPHICVLHDIGRQDDVDFLVMEYLEGETLVARLRRGRLPLEGALTYAIQIAGALGQAHGQGVVHR